MQVATQQTLAADQPTPKLNALQRKRRQRVLTRPEPARVRATSNAVVLKQGNLFLLTDDSGDIPWRLPHGMGLYYQDCRFLDGYTLTLNGAEPIVLSSAAGRGFEAHHDLTNPELPDSVHRARIEKDTVALRRERLIRGGVVHELLTLRNYGRMTARLRVQLRFRARFEDIFVIRGFLARPHMEAPAAAVIGPDALQFRCRGSDGVLRTTTVRFSPAPQQLRPERATLTLTLNPGQECALAISITPCEHIEPEPQESCAGQPGIPPELLRRRLDRTESMWLAGSASLRTSNPLLDRILRRGLLDLGLLRSRLHGRHYFAAGIPWFTTLFGRDAAIAAIQMLPYGTRVARDTLLLLADYQATRVDAFRSAEPGKVLHEYRCGELARGGVVPQSPAYYGTVDATALFLILLAQYLSWSGDLELARELRPTIEAALTWIDEWSDHDHDGYLDYGGDGPESSLVNQGWKDAGDAIVNADGSPAEPPIALCEVQAYAYKAWNLTAQLLCRLGEPARAAALEQRAEQLRERFESDFWSDRLGCYVLARQRGGRPAEVIASNAGQVLWGGIASSEHAARVVKQMMAPDMFSGWGIRTLSTQAAAYNPVSYHRGSVWPHDNGLIASGFHRYGHDAAALQVLDALFAAACGFRDFRMPELYCGYERRTGEAHPVRYPVACSPQAWAAGAIPYLLRSVLGLRADALAGRLEVMRPRLPVWLDWLEISCMRVGDSRVDMRFERVGPDGLADVHSIVREGDLHIERIEVP